MSNKKHSIEELKKFAQAKNGECLSAEYRDTHARYRWQCKDGHEWQASWAHVERGSWCPICSGRVATPETALSATHPHLAKEWNHEKNKNLVLTPANTMAGSNKKVWWKCEKGHKWQAMVINRVRGSSGCPCCYKERRKKGKT
jgi:hypothetical protein